MKVFSGLLGAVLGLFLLVYGSAAFAAAEKEATPATESTAPKEVGTDTNKDGKPDRWEYYESGVLIRVEADSNFDDKVDETGFVEGGKIVRVEKDSDYDGKVDKWVNY